MYSYRVRVDMNPPCSFCGVIDPNKNNWNRKIEKIVEMLTFAIENKSLI